MFAFRLAIASLACVAALCRVCSILVAGEPVAPAAQPAQWEWSGWGGGGYFWSAAADPADPRTIYLGGDVNGVAKSTDQGKSWTLMNKGLSNYEVYSLIADPQNGKTLYALTVNGLNKSVDGAGSWRLLPATDAKNLKIICKRGLSIHAVAVDAKDSGLVYAGNPDGQLFKSVDGGETWEGLKLPALGGTGPKACTGDASMVVRMKCEAASWDRFGRVEKIWGDKPQDWSAAASASAALYAPEGAPKIEVQLVIQSGEKWLWQAGDWVVLKPGAWTEAKLDLSKQKDINAVHAFYVIVRSTEAAYTGELRLDSVALTSAAGEKTMLADWETAGSIDGWGVHKKDKNFTLMEAVWHSARPDNGGIASVVADPVAGATVYAATVKQGMFKSVNAGKDWKPLQMPALSVKSVAVAAANNKIIFAALDKAGLFKSVDAGATWQPTGLQLKEKWLVKDVAVSRTNSERVYCLLGDGDWGGMVGVSDDGGATWRVSGSFKRDLAQGPTLPAEGTKEGMKPMSALTNLTICDPAGEIAFASANWSCVLTTDGGKTWGESNKGADITCATDVCFHNGKVYATAMDEGLLMSADNGKTWQQLSPLRWSNEISGHSWRVKVSGEPGKERIIATRSPWNAGLPNLVIVSEDGGKTFKPVKSGLPDYRSWKNCMWGMAYARALAIDPKNPQTVYLGIDGDPENGKVGGGVFKSVDGGLNWQQLPVQPGSRRMYYGLAVDPTDSNRLFWGACNDKGGVYRSEDAGASWQKVYSGDYWIFNLTVAADGTVYAAGKNLYRSADHGKSWKAINQVEEGTTVVGIETDPRDPKTLWYSTTSWDSNASGGIYKTIDGGATWTNITGNLPCRKTQVLRFNPQTNELWAVGVGLNKTRQ